MSGNAADMAKATRLTRWGSQQGRREFAEREVMEFRLRSAWLHSGELDHLSPLLGFLGDQLAEVGG